VQQRQTATITLHLEGEEILDTDIEAVVAAAIGGCTLPDLRLVKVVATKRAELEL
jgi:hypothetical protein